MASIDDFVNHRWQDAKEQLRKLDPDFVNRTETIVRLERAGLEPPWTSATVEQQPKQQLSRKWHRLLEVCHGLTTEKSLFEGTAGGLTATANYGLPPVEAGRRFFQHTESWFAHAKTLTEYADRVIDSTVEVYALKPEIRTKLKERIYKEVTKEGIEGPRNAFIHPQNPPWSSRGITEAGLWERSVAGGLTPHDSLIEYIFPLFGNRLMSGEYYEAFVTRTAEICSAIGSILYELEANIAESR